MNPTSTLLIFKLFTSTVYLYLIIYNINEKYKIQGIWEINYDDILIIKPKQSCQNSKMVQQLILVISNVGLR